MADRMKAVRLILRQSSAHYRKEETIDNKMTYPLPPISTVIGAIHSACGYREYHPMNVSIQGKYEAMHKEPYTDYCFLNSTMDDRGILVKMKNESLLSCGYTKVAKAMKSQGNSFRNNITIQVYEQQLLEEFQQLKQKNDEIQEFKKTTLKDILTATKKQKEILASEKKQYTKDSQEFKAIGDKEKQIKAFEKALKARVKEYEDNNYTIPISRFRSLTTSLKYYEVLDNVTLILHIQAEEQVLEDIMNHQFDLVSIGRSEDFITLEEAKLVELEEYDGDEEITSPYSAYIDMKLLKDDQVTSKSTRNQRRLSGTKYYINKEYEIINEQRVFNKLEVFYVSQYSIEETDGTRNLYIDTAKREQSEKEECYIVNLL